MRRVASPASPQSCVYNMRLQHAFTTCVYNMRFLCDHGNPLRPSLIDPLTARSFKQPLLRLSVSCAALSQCTMVAFMGVITVVMEDQGYSYSDAVFVIEMHCFAMFFPSFFTGHLVNMFGAFTINAVGVLLYVPVMVTFALGDSIDNFWVGMFLLGIAW